MVDHFNLHTRRSTFSVGSPQTEKLTFLSQFCVTFCSSLYVAKAGTIKRTSYFRNVFIVTNTSLGFVSRLEKSLIFFEILNTI